MAESTEISWTDHTLNLWWGCAKVHAGCDHCYAEAFAHRYGHEIWGPKAPRKASKSAFRDVLKFQKKAAADGVIRRVFVGSMMDIFEKPFPLIDSQGNELPETTGHLRTRFFEEVVPQCPNLLFLLLTKRPGNILKYIPEEWKSQNGAPKNVMYGTSVVNQETADEMIPKLLQVPGRLFLSMEPLLGPVKLGACLSHAVPKAPNSIFLEDAWYDNPLRICKKGHISRTYLKSEALGRDACLSCHSSLMPWKPAIEWVIVGGESGPGARPMNIKWAQSIRDQCIEAGTQFHFKQWGEWAPHEVVQASVQPSTIVARLGYKCHDFTPDLVAKFPGDNPHIISWKVGKHEAGNMLDSRAWQDVPTI